MLTVSLTVKYPLLFDAFPNIFAKKHDQILPIGYDTMFSSGASTTSLQLVFSCTRRAQRTQNLSAKKELVTCLNRLYANFHQPDQSDHFD